MCTVTSQLPDALKQSIEELAAKEGFSLDQFLASAASEQLAVMQTVEYLHREAQQGRREQFEKYLAAVPSVPPIESDRLE